MSHPHPDTLTLAPADARPTYTLANDAGLNIELQPNGCVRRIRVGEVLISHLFAEPVAGGMHRLYLRVHGASGVTAREIIGPRACGAFACRGRAAAWRGETLGLRYRVTLRLDADAPRWRWHATIENPTPDAVTADAIHVQDVGLAGEGAVRNNEKYTAQYVDHRVEAHPALGPVVMSRQAVPQHGGAHPWLISGCTPGAAGVMTDGVRFFGTTHKADGVPALLHIPTLPTEHFQHEAAAHVLQAAPQTIAPGDTATLTFLASFEADHPDASSPADTARLLPTPATDPQDDGPDPSPQPARTLFQTAALLSGESPSDQDLIAWFGPAEAWRHVERDDAGQALSFFTHEACHVATAPKEAALRRGHGHLLRTGTDLLPTPGVISATLWAHGVFGAQLTLGNTTFGMMSGVVRDPINLQRATGTRLFVELDGGWCQLAVASAFAMTPGSGRWVYKLGGHVLEVRCVASVDSPLLRYRFRALAGGPVRVLLSQHVSMGEREDGFATTVILDRAAARFTATPSPDTWQHRAYPGTRMVLAFDDATRLDALGGDELLHSDGLRHGSPYLAARSRPVELLGWSVAAATEPASIPSDLSPDPDDIETAAAAFWRNLAAPVSPRPGGTRRSPDAADGLERLREAMPWMVHNAVIHLSVPHGLEQFGGAAWGVRDVCQGPVEMLLAMGHAPTIRDILRIVFRHQYLDRGDWPQWFMHAPFHPVQSGDCHGDIVVWPLKALCDYLEDTGDLGFLDEPIGYATTRPGYPFSDTTESLGQHVRRALERIGEQSIPGTALIRYGEGDWNDALQPAQHWMRQRMVSPWTVALLHQTLARLAGAVRRAGDTRWADALQLRADAVAADFRQWCVFDGQVAGIVLFSEDYASAEPLLHPADTRTGITASLIPINRGLLAGLYPPASAEAHLSVIRGKLLAPDGARLMDRPPRYTGGTETWFKRAESAAFFGREVGLMYVHAHLRFAEVCAMRGDGDAMLQALGQINPVALRRSVPNATARQANAYFSSSDAAFPDRRTADAEYAKVYDGTIGVDGGWRIYSSGPGILVNLVVRHLLGVRRHYDQLHLDPVLPARESDASADASPPTLPMRIAGRPVTLHFIRSGTAGAPTAPALNGHPVPGAATLRNPYRAGGWSLPLASLETLLSRGDNLLTVPLPA